MIDPEALLKDIVAREAGVDWAELEAVARAIADDAEMNRRMAAEWRSSPRETQEQVCQYYALSKTWLMQTYGNGRGALALLARKEKPELSGWSKEFFRLLPSEGATVLDYGGGFLKDTWFLPAHGIKVVLAEVEGPVTRIVRAFLDEIGENRVSVLPVAGDVPEDMGVHDGAACFEMLEHMVDPVSAARRIVSAVRPGGPVALSVTFGAPSHAPYHIAANAHLGDPETWSGELKDMGLTHVWKDGSSRVEIWRRVS